MQIIEKIKKLLFNGKFQNALSFFLVILFAFLFTLPSISLHLSDCDDFLEETNEKTEELKEKESKHNFEYNTWGNGNTEDHSIDYYDNFNSQKSSQRDPQK